MIEPLRILIIDDSQEDLATYKRLLMNCSKEVDYVFSEFETGEEALASLSNNRPDCILLDYNLPALDGLDLLAELVKQYNKHAPAIIMLTGEGNEGVAVEAMKNGAQDYLVKESITGEGLQRSINNSIEKAELKYLLKLREEELKRVAVTDDLTGLYSRRYIMDHLEKEIYRAKRYDTPFGLALITLDHFKQIKDQYGQLAGDQVLKGFGNLLKKHTRLLDIVGRYGDSDGGEEILVILPNTSLEAAQLVFQRICQKAETLKYTATKEKAFHVTCSIGLTDCDISVKNTDSMIQRAEEALYQAKEQGRNRLCTWSGNPSLISTEKEACS